MMAITTKSSISVNASHPNPEGEAARLLASLLTGIDVMDEPIRVFAQIVTDYGQAETQPLREASRVFKHQASATPTLNQVTPRRAPGSRVSPHHPTGTA